MFGRWRGGKGIGERVSNGVANYVLIVLAKETVEPVGIHNVFAGHVGHGFGRNRRDTKLPHESQDLEEGPLSGHANQFGLSNFDALGKGKRFTPSGDIENGQALGFWFGLMDDGSQQAGDVVYVDKLNLVVEVFLSIRKHAG